MFQQDVNIEIGVIESHGFVDIDLGFQTEPGFLLATPPPNFSSQPLSFNIFSGLMFYDNQGIKAPENVATVVRQTTVLRIVNLSGYRLSIPATSWRIGFISFEKFTDLARWDSKFYAKINDLQDIMNIVGIHRTTSQGRVEVVSHYINTPQGEYIDE